MDGLVVYPERMLRNLERTQGLIYSSKVLNALIESGMQREAAYTIVKKHSMQAWREEVPYRSLLEADPQVRERRQAHEAWLRRVPDDPGGLLRAKFQLEHERRQREGR